jgi:biotin-dependent carboxylase-like uncharacterized protein
VPIEVLKPGLSTTVQDLGRIGYYDVGIPPSGALDQYSLLAANLLVGNADDAAGLECVYLGPQLRFTAPTVVAVTGAEMAPRINGEERPQWEAFSVAEGDVLDFGYLKAGARAYIAVAGGIAVEPVLGSRSTYALGAMGGYEGRPLQEGDALPTPNEAKGIPGRSVQADLRPSVGPEAEIRVVMGLYDHRLTAAGRRTFLETDWTLTPVADRIGCRSTGAVVLHRDAVSGGGYAMVATVISGDLDLVAQSAPNSRTRFVEVDLDGALAARRTYKERSARLRDALQ